MNSAQFWESKHLHLRTIKLSYATCIPRNNYLNIYHWMFYNIKHLGICLCISIPLNCNLSMASFSCSEIKGLHKSPNIEKKKILIDLTLLPSLWQFLTIVLKSHFIEAHWLFRSFWKSLTFLFLVAVPKQPCQISKLWCFNLKFFAELGYKWQTFEKYFFALITRLDF